MKPNVIPSVPPALRKARPAKELSDVPAPTPEPLPVPSKPAPLPPAKPVTPRAPLPPAKPVLAAPLTRPKPVITGRPPVAQLDGREVVFEGSFLVPGEPPFVTETPLTGNGKADRQSVINKARQKYPSGPLSLKSTRIFTREVGSKIIYPKGISVGQLFGDPGTATEAGIEIGSVFWQSGRCQVMLINLRSRNAVNVGLRLPGGGKVAFSNRIAANTPAETLKSVVKEVLGSDARELEITLRVAK